MQKSYLSASVGCNHDVNGHHSCDNIDGLAAPQAPPSDNPAMRALLPLSACPGCNHDVDEQRSCDLNDGLGASQAPPSDNSTLPHSSPHDYNAAMGQSAANKDLLKLYVIGSFAAEIQNTSVSHAANKKAKNDKKLRRFTAVACEPSRQLAVAQAEQPAQLAAWLAIEQAEQPAQAEQHA